MLFLGRGSWHCDLWTRMQCLAHLVNASMRQQSRARIICYGWVLCSDRVRLDCSRGRKTGPGFVYHNFPLGIGKKMRTPLLSVLFVAVILVSSTLASTTLRI